MLAFAGLTLESQTTVERPLTEHELASLPQRKPEAQVVLADLAKDVRNGDCVLFLGAGVHAPPPAGSDFVYDEGQRPCLGSELTKKLAAKGKVREIYPDEPCDDLRRVSLCIEAKFGRKKLIDLLDEHLVHGKTPSPALRMLANLPFKVIVTTNYDPLLELALRDQDPAKDPTVLVYEPKSGARASDVTSDPTAQQPLLLKLHGDVRPDHRDSVVITDEDYIQFIQRMGEANTHPIPETVLYRMGKWPTLFIGYSLRDLNLRLLFRTLHGKLDPAVVPMSVAVDLHPDPLIVHVWERKEQKLTFLPEDLWTFVPWLANEIGGEVDRPGTWADQP